MNRAVIQAGGKGTRLLPYTSVLPKPLMPIGDYPVLEIVIRQLVHFGFNNITIAVGHLGHLIRAVIGDGSRWGANVNYMEEDEPRGTMGSLSNLESPDDQPILVMNGDLLTDIDYASLFEAHVRSNASLTVGVYNKKVPISLGVLDLDPTQRVVGFREKPVLTFPCSMGIYILEPDLVRQIPREGVFGFDDLMGLCLQNQIPTNAFGFDGLWLDIGRPEDYSDALQVFSSNTSRFLRGGSHPVPQAKLAGPLGRHAAVHMRPVGAPARHRGEKGAVTLGAPD
jgi:NDP-sugar pyrophosphorylase family protein